MEQNIHQNDVVVVCIRTHIIDERLMALAA